MTFYTNIITVLRLFTFRMTKPDVQGLENIPQTGGAILVPNHVSNLDPILLGVQVAKKREVRALAKSSLFKTPVVGGVLRKMGHIPVFRNSSTAADALRAAVEAVNRGEIIAMYPEGTIPENISHVGVFKSGAVRLALETGAPIIPIGQWGPQQVLPARVKNNWKYLLKAAVKPVPHRIRIGEPYRVTGTSKDLEHVKHLTADLAQRVEALTAELRNS